MKRWLLVLSVLIVACCAYPVRADEGSMFSQFQVDLVYKKQNIPIIVCHKGKFVVNKRYRLSRGSMLHVKLTATVPDKWVSVCFRDTYGNIYDLPFEQRKMNGAVKEVLFRMPARFSPGEVEFFLGLYGSFDPDHSLGNELISKTQWMTVGEYQLY